MTKRTRKLIATGALAGVVTAAVSLGTIVAGPDATEPEAISDVQCLRKMALDLTYRGPTAEEVADLAAGRLTLAEAADAYLSAPEFERVVFDWYRIQFPPTQITPEAIDVEEPSRIARHIVLNDLDYRLLLTADFTITPEGQVETVADHPAAGVISTQHYMSAYRGNFRRNWAGHFLKEWTPIVLQAITLSPDQEDEDLSPDSLLANPGCVGCHGSEIFGIDFLAPFSSCYGEDGLFVPGCDSATDAAGTFLTETGAGLPELGQIVTASNEFMANSVNFFFTKLFGRSMAKEEAQFYIQAVTRFRQSEYQARELIKFLVTSSAYCAR